MPSKLEAELIRATKVAQAQGESRPKYFVRMLQKGQNITTAAWDNLSGEAQAWYNDSVRLYAAHNNPTDIREFSDYVPATPRAALAPVEPVEEPVEEAPPEPEVEEPEVEVEEEPPVEDEEEPIEDEPPEPVGDEDEPLPEEEPVEDEPLDDEPVEDEVPAVAAAPVKRPASKPTPKPAPKPAAKPPASRKPAAKEPAKVLAKPTAELVEITRPPKPAAPGASTFIKRLLIKNGDITNAELIEKLKAHNIAVSSISVSTIRSDFKHSLKVLQEAGFCQEIPAPL